MRRGAFLLPDLIYLIGRAAHGIALFNVESLEEDFKIGERTVYAPLSRGMGIGIDLQELHLGAHIDSPDLGVI